MTILHRLLVRSPLIRVYEFSYTARPDDVLINPDFLNNLENAYEHAIGLVVGQEPHSIYSSHVAADFSRLFTRIVIVGNINNL